MAIDIPALRAAIDLVAVVGSRVQLTKRGNEFFGLCPFHDEATASFTVTPDKGMYFCFGCGAGGDAIDFIRELDGLSFQDACQQLGSQDYKALPMKAGLAKRKPRLAWWSTVPPDSDNKPASFALSSLGEPSMVWTYKTVDGKPWGYVARYEVEHDGEKTKEIRQWTYGKEGEHTEGDCAWACKHFSKPRPLYGLETLHTKGTETQVLICEGEKACDAGRHLFPQAAVVTWPGGTNGVEYADWSLLYGRKVVLIPDHDEPGQKACQYIAALLASNKCAVSIVQPESTRPKGWDLADALADNWVPSVALEWARANKRAYDPHSTPEMPTDADIKAATSDEAVVRGNGKPKRRTAPTGNLRDADTLPEPADVPPAFSDDALAAQMAHKYGQDWRYVQEWGKWLHWTGTSWEKDRTCKVMNLVRLQCREVVNYEQGALLNEGAKRSLTSKRTHAAVEGVFKTDPTVSTVSDIWDSDPWLLSTPDGVINLKSGECRPNRREDFQTRSTLVAPAGECPLWLSFLDKVTAENTDLQAYLQRLVGYSLTGVTTEQMLAFFFGTGANGKGVFLRTICSIMGGYATTASMDIFAETKNDFHKNVFARLNKMRLVSAQETDEGKRWAEARIKQFTGGDMVQANFMRQDEFEFKPTFKLIFAGNHKPGLRSVDEAMRRRVHIVPFTVTIPVTERDPMLDEKLKAEYPGILQWMIAGCLEWQQGGLRPPELVVNATDEYLEVEDALGEWLECCCELGDSRYITTGDLYRNYVAYCEGIKEHPWSQKRLVQNLQARGITRSRKMGVRVLEGIDLKAGQTTTTESRW